LLFINKRSGGQSGEKIYRKLLRLLNPRQVFLLENDRTIIHALEIYSSLSNIRICVFGGDGTVGWVLGRLAESYPPLNNPPVCICPLGTGNDLSRVLSWGEQYDPKRLLSTLIQIPQAQAIALDRWQVTIEQMDLTNSNTSLSGGRTFLPLLTHPKFIRDTKRPSYQNHRTLPNTRFINYMSFGLDAAIALEFHDRRSRDPTKFSSPLKNKLMYLNESRKYLNDFARSKMWSLSSYIRLICDGENVTDAIRNCHTLLVLNIPGYASGTNPWGKTSNNSSTSPTITIQKDLDSFEQISTSSVELIDLPANTHEVYELITLNDCSNDQVNPSIATTTTNSTGRFERQDFGDKKIEVVGLSTTHMATIHIGFRGIRIAQCSQLRIELCCPMTAQMDGEPFYLPESVAVNITHAGQVLVLRNENR
jgi:diacylglycerol kinase family enzyme